MTAAAPEPDGASRQGPGLFDVLALALVLAGGALLVATREPGWSTLLVVAAAAVALATSDRTWLVAELLLVGVAWAAGALGTVLTSSAWTLLDTADWVRQVVPLALAVGLALVARHRAEHARVEVHEMRAFAQDATVHDALTGLANRKGLAMLGSQILESARRRGDAVYCVFLDVDGLAKVNTELGHEVGDEVLLTVAEAITRSTRATDAVARWGDDEFVVVGPGTGLAPLEIERRVRARCLETTTVERSVWQARISAGGAVLEPWDDGDVDSLLRLADREMHLRRTLRREAATPAYQPVRHDPSPRPPDSRKPSGWPD